MSRGDSRASTMIPGHQPARPDPRADQEKWYRQAYRQMVEKDSWKSAELVDDRTQTFLEAMPERAEGHYFVDPFGKYRKLGSQQREKPDVMTHRVANVGPWLERLPGKGTTRYADLAELDANTPHPGEDEQVAAWMEESRLFDPDEDYFGTGLTPSGVEGRIELTKAPVGKNAILADAPFDQIPPRAFSTHPSTPPAMYGRTGRVNTQPRDEVAPVVLPESSATPPSLRLVKEVLGIKKEIQPPSNFAAPAPQPYPSAPGVLSTEQTIHALDLQPEELKILRWDRLADRLKSRDNYDPRDFSVTFKNQEPRQNARRGTSPEVAAQDAIDAAHELNLAKGRDWGTDLPRDNPDAILGEYEHAVETLMKEAGDFWTERVRREPLAAEVEMMRAYIEPRIVNYFPTETRNIIRSNSVPPNIQSGPQGAQDLVTALAFGHIKEITINGKKLDFPTTTQNQADANQARRFGAHGGLTSQRLNYLIGQEVQKMLATCKEVSRSKIVGGPLAPSPKGSKPYERVAEYMLQDPHRAGTKGSVRTDVAIRLWYQGKDCVFHINTVDMVDDSRMSGRERDAFEKALVNSIAMFQSFVSAEKRWKVRNKEDLLSQRNVIAAAPKADGPDEADIQKVLEDFLTRISCAQIIAECNKGAGSISTLPTRK